ncbi:MAG TPA: ABC transporter substrate-binding protein [Candidatus Lustribacter sp.]|nr:ABC transporter substrate-binding protein [Candidatus Lustribacter sp.]
MRRAPFLISLASSAVAVRAGAQTPPSVTLATLINDTATAALYAAHAGLFTKAGLNVQMQVLSAGAAAQAAVAGGAAQFGLSSLVGVITAHVKGVPFTLVAPAGVATSDVAYSQFVVRTDSPIKTAHDLNGKTIGAAGLKDLDAVAIMNWVDQNGGDSKSLKFVEMPAPIALAAIEDGRIDGADLNTPTLTRGLEGGKVRTLAQIFDAIAPRFENTAWFTTTDYANANRDVVQRFARAMSESNAYCNAHHAETVALVADNAKIDEKVVARMARITFGDYLRPADLQPLINVTAKYGVIPKAFDARELISPYALKPPG